VGVGPGQHAFVDGVGVGQTGQLAPARQRRGDVVQIDGLGLGDGASASAARFSYQK
jgi:hypothetical protein